MSTSIYRFNDANWDAVDEPYWQDASYWTVYGIVRREFPRER